jgi:hypothetical protein
MPRKPAIFRSRNQRSPVEAGRAYDQHRGSARDRGYDARWDRAAVRFRHERPLCLGCEAVNRIVACTVVDHVEPHRGDMVKFWDRSKWQPSCDWHHSTIKQMLELLFDQGKVPASALWLNSPEAIAMTLDLRP